MDLATTVEQWASNQQVNVELLEHDGTPYYELSWKDGAVTRFIDVYQTEPIIIQHGTYGYESRPERQRGPITRVSLSNLSETLTHLRPSVDEMPARPWRYTPVLGDTVAKMFKFR